MRFCLDQMQGSPILVPFDDAAHRFMAAQTDGEPKLFELELLHPRDMIEHRRIFAYIDELAEALHTAPEKVRAELLYATGNFQVLGEMSGMPVVIAVNSMSKHAMKDHELHAFWDEAKEVIESKLLPRVQDAAERSRLAEKLMPQAA